MAENKKSSGNPPAKLVKEVLKNSIASTWEEAVPEWYFYKFYNEPKGKLCFCCSPRENKNITVLINGDNMHKLEICNACAERYFDMLWGKIIENAVRRLKKNIDWGVNADVLDYLFECRVIDEEDYNNYEIVSLKRDSKHSYSDLFRKVREDINARLLIYTDYKNKEFFHLTEYMLGTSKEFPRLDIDRIISLRQRMLQGEEVPMSSLYDIMDRTGGDGSYYEEAEKNRLLDAYLKKMAQHSIKRYLDIKEYRDRITLFKPLNPFEIVNGEWEIIRPQRGKQEQTQNQEEYRKPPKLTPQEIEQLAYGLEEEPIDLNDYPIDYDSDEEWDDVNFEEDEFANDAGGCSGLLEKFYEILLDWARREMERQDYKPNRVRDNTNHSLPYPYSVEQVIDFFDIEELRVGLRKWKNTFSSLYEVMVEMECSVKCTYQILDLLMRKSDKEIKTLKLGKLKALLSRHRFRLVHDDNVTRIERTAIYKAEQKSKW